MEVLATSTVPTNMIAIMFGGIESLLSLLRRRKLSFASGQYVFHLGDPVEVLYFVDTGAIRLARHQSDGSVLILQRAGPGSILAEASLYSEAYHCDAVAEGPVTTHAFSKTDLLERLQAAPEHAEAWARHLAHELQRARLQSEILSLKTVALRLDAWIAWKGGDIPLKGRRKEIASQLGVSPEALYRENAGEVAMGAFQALDDFRMGAVLHSLIIS
jgi:CRP/FNR family transcriptional regulator, dissimilatory nitrate respiration regulator